MTKEEILRKAQNENDEMEQAILTKALGISTIVIPILCLIFIIIRIIHSEYIISDLVAITFAQLSISQLYQSIKMKNKILLLIGLAMLILTISFTIGFINEVSI